MITRDLSQMNHYIIIPRPLPLLHRNYSNPPLMAKLFDYKVHPSIGRKWTLQKKRVSIGNLSIQESPCNSTFIQSLPNPSATYYSNLALAYKANGDYEKSIAIVDEMNSRPSLRTYEYAGLFRKAQIVKARCIIIQVSISTWRSINYHAG